MTDGWETPARSPLTRSPLTRRQLLASATAAAAAMALAGCGSGSGADGGGSTLTATWADPTGDGQLQLGPGEPLLDRVELGPRASAGAELARFVHLTDAHVMDASSPARVPFLARLGPPVQSTFRPQEALTAQVLHGAINAARASGATLVIQGGDLIDNDQNNELTHALTLLNGGRVSPGSGRDGYYGVQLASDSDPFYYRPEIDAPRHPGMLAAAVAPFRSPGLAADWLPVLGDHDALVAGELVPNGETQSLAVGNRALWELPTGLKLPPGFKLNPSGSPDGPPDPSFVASFLAQALAGPTVSVPPDAARYELTFTEAVDRLWSGAALRRQAGVSADTAAAAGQQLDYVRDVGAALRIIVLDITQRAGGSGGTVTGGQPAWLAAQIASAGARWIVVVTHQPLISSTGGEQLLAVMDRSPRVIAALAGHIHRNQIRPRRTAAGGYWLITTSSLIDYPQQCRALSLLATDGGVVLETWMLDHTGNGRLGTISRQLAYLDAAGGRPNHFAGTPADRNVRLYRRGV